MPAGPSGRIGVGFFGGEILSSTHFDRERIVSIIVNDDLVKSLLECHPGESPAPHCVQGESRGLEQLEITGFRLSPE